MSKRISVAVALVGMCALSLLLPSCGNSSSRPSGLLYVLTQGITDVNNGGPTVSSYAVNLNSGGLSLVNSSTSTCPTASTSGNLEPCGLPLDILLDSTGATAFVLNQGVAVPVAPNPVVPPTIISYPINSDGSLGTPTAALPTDAALPGTPIAMTRDSAGKFLFVLDVGSDTTACGLTPTVACASISVFNMQSGSTTLSAVAGSPFPLGRIPSALSVIPFTAPTGNTLPCATTTDFLYITFNSDPALHNDNTLSAYCVDSSGVPNDLTPPPQSPYVTSPNPISVLAVNTNPAGEISGGVFVYVGSQASHAGALDIYDVCVAVGTAPCNSLANIGQLIPVTSPTPPTPGQNPLQMVVDPTSEFLYVMCKDTSQVFAYKITTASGALTALSGSASLSTGSQPVSMALHASVGNTGQFLFTSNSASSNVTGFSLNTLSGVMSALPAETTTSVPSGMAVR